MVWVVMFAAATLVHAQSSPQLQSFNPCPASLAIQNQPEPAADRQWDFTFSPYTLHWTASDEHKPVVMVSLDHGVAGNRFCGLTLFSNSFGQPSAYAYVGSRWDQWLGVPKLFVKVTAGLMYGYVAPYEEKVPLNYKGFNPALIPSVGYQFTDKDSVQMLILGNAAIMLAWGRAF